MIAYQDIPVPDVEGILTTSNQFIIDNGVIVFALVLFAIVILGMMFLMFMMLRGMGKETNQQNKLITQYGLTLAQLERNTATVSSVKNSFDTLAMSIDRMVNGISSDHREQKAGMETIIPAIENLSRQFESQQGSVEAMNGTIGNQNDSIQQILDAILRLEAQVSTLNSNFDTFQSDGKKLGDGIQSAQQDIIALKDDVTRLKSDPETPKPIDKKEEGTTE